MRTIKFRAWDKVEQEMFNPETENNNEMFFVGLVNGKLRCSETQYDDGDDFILMQFTGLTDKNGKEIYEKDILEFDNRRHVVTFDNGGFGIWKDVRVDLYSNQMRKLREPLWNLVVDECEIVGNVYQDKHLLEESE